MKIFVSRSGKLSCKIAETLKKWIPCILQSVEVFFSPEDIEKGDNWDKTISTELSECKYGIICLTAENTTAPWINFEAGAIAKSLDSKVTALMVNIKPSDIKGPLSRYQATKFEKDDFFQLVTSINNELETPLELSVLKNTFNAMWASLESETLEAISKHSKKGVISKPQNNNSSENEAMEEILQLLRQQSALLSNPEKLLPMEYMENIQRIMYDKNRDLSSDYDIMTEEILHYIENVLKVLMRLPENSFIREALKLLKFENLLQIIMQSTQRMNNQRMYAKIRQLERNFQDLTYSRQDELSKLQIEKNFLKTFKSSES